MAAGIRPGHFGIVIQSDRDFADAVVHGLRTPPALEPRKSGTMREEVREGAIDIDAGPLECHRVEVGQPTIFAAPLGDCASG
jgi:hypothetical protein